MNQGRTVERSARSGWVQENILDLPAVESKVGQGQGMEPAPNFLDVANRGPAVGAEFQGAGSYCSETTAPGSPRAAFWAPM
jgi:hypothetical protein